MIYAVGCHAISEIARQVVGEVLGWECRRELVGLWKTAAEVWTPHFVLLTGVSKFIYVAVQNLHRGYGILTVFPFDRPCEQAHTLKRSFPIS